MLTKLFKKLTGIDKLEASISELEQKQKTALTEAEVAINEAEKAKHEEELAKMSAKERATAQGEPYIAVLDTHVKKDNVRNGFFELDWNDVFVLQLKQAGYGADGDPDEEIVDRWFRTLCADVANENGIDMTDRGAGYINVKPIAEGKSEVS